MLDERLNVPITQLSQTEPDSWALERGQLTTRDLGVYAGRSIMHGYRNDFHSKWPHQLCRRLGGKVARAASDDVDCIFCLAILAREQSLCCVCSIRWVCGCRCQCHKNGAPRSAG